MKSIRKKVRAGIQYIRAQGRGSWGGIRGGSTVGKLRALGRQSTRVLITGGFLKEPSGGSKFLRGQGK